MHEYKATVSKWRGEMTMLGSKKRSYCYDIHYRDCSENEAAYYAKEMQSALDAQSGPGIYFVSLMKWTKPLGYELSI